jgi:hypothetical protein
MNFRSASFIIYLLFNSLKIIAAEIEAHYLTEIEQKLYCRNSVVQNAGFE